MSDVIKVAEKKVKDTQSRKYLLTINNPADFGLSHDKIKEVLGIQFKSLVYWCMSDEVGLEGTYHTHVFIACTSGVRFSTIKKHFGCAHIDPCNGTSQQNTDYVFKEGKWRDDAKGETNLRNTHECFGEMPVESQGARNDLHELYDMIKEGRSNFEIMETNPDFIMKIEKVDKVRQIIRYEEFKNKWRDLDVTYITGVTDAGKTRGVMEMFGSYDKVYRVTLKDHKNPWDGYEGEDVILFEEFRDSFDISDMLNYLDGYPVKLPCRYVHKQACFTKVFIASNWDLGQQYKDIQNSSVETWKAFLRRVHRVTMFVDKGESVTIKDISVDNIPCLSDYLGAKKKDTSGEVSNSCELEEIFDDCIIPFVL